MSIKETAEKICDTAKFQYRDFQWNYIRKPRYAITRWIKWWAPSDTWNLDYTLRKIVPEMLRYLADTVAWAPAKYFDAEHKEDQAWKWKAMLREAADNIQATIPVQEKFDRGEYATWHEENYAEFDRDYKLARVKERKGWKFIAENIDGLWD